jgi:hypothetical protein
MAKRGRKVTTKNSKRNKHSQQEPYINPETGESRGNPNDIITLPESENRGNQFLLEMINQTFYIRV